MEHEFGSLSSLMTWSLSISSRFMAMYGDFKVIYSDSW
jgi:hypothetical protein